MALQDGGVDEMQRFFVRKRDVEHTEEGDEARIHLITASSCFPHGCDEAQVLQCLAVEFFSPVKHPAPVQEQLQQGYGLLRAVIIHLTARKRDKKTKQVPDLKIILNHDTGIDYNYLTVLPLNTVTRLT